MLYVGLATMIVAMWVTWAVTPGVIRLAGLLGGMDLPGGRKTHAEPMPRIGGVAVFAGFLAGIAFAGLLTGTLFAWPRVDLYWRGLILAASGLFLVGLADDLWSLSYRWKFAAQIVAAAYVWYCGFRIELITNPLGGGVELGMLSLPATVLWIVAITNAVNLIDGLDGLAAGIALITTVAVAVIAFYQAELGVTAASVALAGSLVGFLRFNFNPARIFLGDSGSMFLGFVLAVTSVRGSAKGSTAVAILAPILVLGLPLLDTSMAVARRLYRLGNHGRQADRSLRYVLRNINHVFLPDRGHIHHRLLDLGLSHRGAVLILYATGCLLAGAAFALVLFNNLVAGLLLISVLAIKISAFGLLWYLRAWRAARDDRPAAKAAVGPAPAPTGIKPLASSGGRAP